jgi:hypothetical protein
MGTIEPSNRLAYEREKLGSRFEIKRFRVGLLGQPFFVDVGEVRYGFSALRLNPLPPHLMHGMMVVG